MFWRDWHGWDKNNFNPSIISLYPTQVHSLMFVLLKLFCLSNWYIGIILSEHTKSTNDISKLNIIKDLRNDVMHHSPLLFNYNYESSVAKTLKRVEVLKELLPKRYQNGLIKKLKYSNDKTKENISKKYYECLLFKED